MIIIYPFININNYSYGDYLIVGVFNDSIVNQYHESSVEKSNLPIMNMQERVLSVLGCRYADDVLIDAPYVISREMVHSLHISVVLVSQSSTIIYTPEAHKVAKDLDIVQYIDHFEHQSLTGMCVEVKGDVR